MRRYVARAALTRVRSGKALLALSVLGVALGVGSALSIRLLNRGALGAFEGSVRAVSGQAALSVVGTSTSFPEGLYAGVLAEPGVEAAIPITRTEVALDGPGAPSFLEVLGVDLVAPARLPWQGERRSLADALAAPGWIAVSPEFARERGLGVGARIHASAGSRRVELTVGALVDFRRANPLASTRLAVMDIAQAQTVFGLEGRLHQVDLVLAPGAAVADVAPDLERRLGAGVRAVTPEQRVAEASGLLAAFRLNLTALSLVSLLVGGFLVYGSTQAALVRRREEVGLLRSVGATRGQVLGLLLLEAAGLGAAGTALGIPLGWIAARAELASVSRTVVNVYLLEGIESVSLGPADLLLATALGLCGALVGAALPALDVARRDPRALLASLTLEERASRAVRPLFAAAVLAVPVALGAYLALAPRHRSAGFVLAAGILLALPLAAPAAVRLLSALGRPRRLSVAFGARTLALHLPSSAVAVGALAVAVAMLVGVTVMVESFRVTVVRWLDATLRADVYVTTPSWSRARGEATLSPRVLARLESEPGVRHVDTLRQAFARVDGRRVSVIGVGAGADASGRVRLLSGDARAALERVAEGAALVSEPLARKAGAWPGSAVRIDGPAGARALDVAGVYYDYGSEAGTVLVDAPTFARIFGDGAPSNAALYLAPGVRPDTVVDAVRADLPEDALLVRSNRSLRAEVLSIFEETFAVTRLLRAMGLLVAVAGVSLTLLVAARERRAEVALYRALGATRWQAFRVFAGKGLGIAALGTILGFLGGAGLAAVLVRVVNRDFFGWTLELHWPVGALSLQAALIFAAAAAASLYPAAASSDAPATELSRDAL
ncbi:MAG TPA: FtsX-like permease family protein [Anaeromyxobacteraceae bacterium]|nr:FtsX-like permease family protein [Anaeromyxobacteraceae bacterium]